MASKATHEVTIGVRPVNVIVSFSVDGSILATSLQYAQIQPSVSHNFTMSDLAGGIDPDVTYLGQQLADAMFEALENFKPKTPTSRRR